MQEHNAGLDCYPHPSAVTDELTESRPDSIARPPTTSRKRPWRDEAILRELYEKRGLSLEQTADRLGCSYSTVRKWIHSHDITITDARGGGDVPDDHPVTFRSYNVNAGLYEKWTHRQQFVPHHRLLAVAKYGFDAVRGMDVHHKNRIPWDNRPDNIELLTPEEHGRVHHPPEGGA